MCGIVGYIGTKEAQPIILAGLKRLEYRGYDSAGLAVINPQGIERRRAQGKLSILEAQLKLEPLKGTLGVGHTRWATHGKPNEINAHPHKAGSIVLVHNGIIENYAELKAELTKKGRTFESETDTEVLAHLIDDLRQSSPSLLSAVQKAVKRANGAYATVVLCEKDPGVFVVAKHACPLVIGFGEGENFVASDVPALLDHTRNFAFMDEGEVAEIRADKVSLFDAAGKPVTRAPKHISWTAKAAEKEGYKHFMLKEIHEQPQAVANTLLGRILMDKGEIVVPELDVAREGLVKAQKMTIIACGTAYYAGLVGKFLIEKLARMPCEVDLASEFRYRNPVIEKGQLVMPISQSGETADTLAALKLAKEQGAHIVSICNTVDSSIARDSQGVFYTRAGPEIGVASTKAFTCQLIGVALMAIYIGRLRKTLSASDASDLLHALLALPRQMEEVLAKEPELKVLAEAYKDARDFLFLGRGVQYPIALEGALKLKEISYIHAEGYPAGELKHGPIALVDENMPVVVIATKNALYPKVISNLEEVRARGGKIIAVGNAGDEELKKKSETFFAVPQTHELLEPLLTVLPLQILAYHVADLKGLDVDQPRNLAKSVTVE